MGIYIQYNPLFLCSDFWSQTCQMWGGGGIFSCIYAISNISRKNNSGNKKQNIFLFRKTIVDRNSGNLYPIYIYIKKFVVLSLAGDLGWPSCRVITYLIAACCVFHNICNLHFFLFWTLKLLYFHSAVFICGRGIFYPWYMWYTMGLSLHCCHV